MWDYQNLRLADLKCPGVEFSSYFLKGADSNLTKVQEIWVETANYESIPDT